MRALAWTLLCPTLVPAQITRPPAVPLVTHDPYFSVWSCHDRLTDGWTTHWTGRTQAISMLVRVDGQPYRLCGPAPHAVPAAAQTACVVEAASTRYGFVAGAVGVEVVFAAPHDPGDLERFARPITHLVVSLHSRDGKPHAVDFQVDASAEWCVNTPDQEVRWTRARLGELEVLAFASQEQPVLQKRGDDLRIDWGTFYLVAADAPAHAAGVFGHDAARDGFCRTGALPEAELLRQPRAASDGWPVLAHSWHGLQVAAGGAADATELWLLFGYDDRYGIEYFERKLRPYWRRGGREFAELLRDAHADRREAVGIARKLDQELRAACARVGGPGYADLCALAFRQTLAAHKLVADIDGRPLLFSKENFSNGCIATVDVLFPAAPFFLACAPDLLEAQLVPLLEYAASPRWKWPFAPHDLGTYPLANGQVYGGGETSDANQMPVEETGNMLLLLAALAQRTGSAALAQRYWPLCEKWAAYLREHGLDPANQLCTDDFAGHLARNANLSVKAIVALGAHARLCERLGKPAAAQEYMQLAQRFATEWQQLARDGDHYRLAFDRAGTWSQKYNLIWQKLLGLELFRPEVARREVAFYLTRQNLYGLPLDGRETYTKLDFLVWTAALAESRPDFDALLAPILAFLNATPDRVPMTDWYRTTDARCVGFRARSVVGAVYMPVLLTDPGQFPFRKGR